MDSIITRRYNATWENIFLSNVQPDLQPKQTKNPTPLNRSSGTVPKVIFSIGRYFEIKSFPTTTSSMCIKRQSRFCLAFKTLSIFTWPIFLISGLHQLIFGIQVILPIKSFKEKWWLSACHTYWPDWQKASKYAPTKDTNYCTKEVF